jgi:CPA1 family monovalent cation:H+ antiporter
MLSFAGLAKPIDRDHKLVMLWGGMRGAVSLALALAATENTSLPPEVRQFVGILATGFVLFTLLVTAPTMRPLMRLLNISSLGPAEAAVNQWVIGLTLSSIPEEIETVGRQHKISPEIVAEVAKAYDGHARDPTGVADPDLPAELRERAALYVLADREQEFCLDYFESRTVSRRVAANLLGYAARLRDGVRSEGVEGYQRAAARILAFDRALRLSRTIHHRLGIARPLARLLGDRFEVQLAARFVLQNVIAFNRDQIERVFGAGAKAAMAEQLDRRFAAIDRAIAALKLQYPTYARQLEVQYLVRLATRLEDERYRRLRAESMINQDMYDDLRRKLRPRRRAVEVRPALDLGLKRDELIARVPMFTSLDTKARRSLARMLRPRLAVPDEVVVHKGERGDAMYFISSGAVEARILPTPVQLGTGDFFGELALLVADRRTADVVALGYCQLLSLSARDLHRLFGSEPALRDQIHAVAMARTASAGNG